MSEFEESRPQMPKRLKKLTMKLSLRTSNSSQRREEEEGERGVLPHPLIENRAGPRWYLP